MRVVIIEDEKLSADHLTLLLKKVAPSINVVKYIDSIRSTVKAFEDGLQCDLIFMDIHLADGSSFELFNRIKLETPIIFTTAYDNYAIQAFKQNSIDYILKPVTLNDVTFALDKFNKHQRKFTKQQFDNITNTYKNIEESYKTRFLVRVGEKIDSIQVEEIDHFESKDSFTFLVTLQNKKFIIEYSLDQLENILPPHYFFRINRKAIIHIQSIKLIKPHFNNRLSVISDKLNHDTQVVSRERVAEFKKWLNK